MFYSVSFMDGTPLCPINVLSSNDTSKTYLDIVCDKFGAAFLGIMVEKRDCMLIPLLRILFSPDNFFLHKLWEPRETYIWLTCY